MDLPLSVSCVFYTSCMFFITCFTPFGKNKRAMYHNFCSNLPWFNKVFYLSWKSNLPWFNIVFYLSWKSNQLTNRSPLLYAGAYETRKWPQKTPALKPWIIQSVTLPLSAATYDSALPRFCIQFLVTYSCILPRLGFKRCLPFDCICRTDFSVHRPYAISFDLKTMWYPLTSTSICGTASTSVLFMSILLRSIKCSQFLSNSFP